MSAAIQISPTRAGSPCFGKSWDPNDVECTGGIDPGYVHPYTKENRRDVCDLLLACSTRVAAEKLDPQRLIPASRLVRDKQVPVLPFTLPQTKPPTQTTAPSAHAAPVQYQHPQQVQHYSGSVLSVPEQRHEDEPFSHFMFRTVIRSLLKGLFQGLVHVFDNHRLK